MMNGEEKIRLAGGLVMFGGIGCLFVLALGYLVHLGKIEKPVSSVEGIVISYTPSYSIDGDSRQSATCVVHYKVGDKTYNIVDTCGAEIFGSGERLGDRVEVMYSTENPSKGAVKRIGFFNCVGVLSLPLLIFGWLLLRKSRRMLNQQYEETDF